MFQVKKKQCSESIFHLEISDEQANTEQSVTDNYNNTNNNLSTKK